MVQKEVINPVEKAWNTVDKGSGMFFDYIGNTIANGTKDLQKWGGDLWDFAGKANAKLGDSVIGRNQSINMTGKSVASLGLPDSKLAIQQFNTANGGGGGITPFNPEIGFVSPQAQVGLGGQTPQYDASMFALPVQQQKLTQEVTAKPQVEVSSATGSGLADIMAQQKTLGIPQDGILGPQTRQAQAISNYQDAIIAGADPSTLQSPYSDNMWETNRMENQLATPTAPPQGTSFMDMFGLGDMSSKDIYSGIGSAAQLGIGAYGMFKSLDQMDTRLNQGQQALDLSREEYEENLRRRQAITAQNRGA